MSNLIVRVVADEILSPCEWMMFEEADGQVTVAVTFLAAGSPAVSEEIKAAYLALRRQRHVRAA